MAFRKFSITGHQDSLEFFTRKCIEGDKFDVNRSVHKRLLYNNEEGLYLFFCNMAMNGFYIFLQVARAQLDLTLVGLHRLQEVRMGRLQGRFGSLVVNATGKWQNS